MFSLPAILNQGVVKPLPIVSYCPQDVSLFRSPRVVNAIVNYCPQDVSLLRSPRTVDAIVSYCPQDRNALPTTP